MFKAINLLLAALIGFATWRLAFVLAGGAHPFGRSGALEAVTFFAPVVGTVLPNAILKFERGSEVAGAWLIAGAPLAGLLNAVASFCLALVLMSVTGAKDVAMWVSALLLAALWQAPLLRAIRAGAKRENPPPDADPALRSKP